MKFVYDDGGRRAAGFQGRAGDCVARAIAIASGRSYDEVYGRLADGNARQRITKKSLRSKAGKRTARNGISTDRKWFKDYMAELGFRWVSTMSVGSGCKVHLAEGELPSGRLVVRVSKHCVAVIDGVIHDTFNPAERGCTVYSLRAGEKSEPYWRHLRTLPDGSSQWAYEPKRCVYGYWIFEGGA